MDNDDKIAALIADLDHLDKPTIRAAVDKLMPLAADRADLRAKLNQLLIDRKHGNLWPIAYLLGHLAKPSDAVVETLLEGLNHREPDIRWAIALLLVRMAQTEGDLIARLMELCRSGTSNQKRMAIYCIRDLHLSDAASLAALLDPLGDLEPTVRVAAVTSLIKRSDIDSTGRNKLYELFSNDPELKVRNAAAVSLAQMGSPPEGFLAALKKAADSEHAQLRKAAAAALAILKKRRSAPTGG